MRFFIPVKTMTDLDYQSCIDEARQLAYLHTGIKPAAFQQAQLTSVVVTLRSELAAESSVCYSKAERKEEAKKRLEKSRR